MSGVNGLIYFGGCCKLRDNGQPFGLGLSLYGQPFGLSRILAHLKVRTGPWLGPVAVSTFLAQ